MADPALIDDRDPIDFTTDSPWTAGPGGVAPKRERAPKRVAAEHPDDLIPFLRDAATWSDFAASLLRGYERFGSLTDRQEAAARSMKEKTEAKAAADRQPESPEIKALVEAMVPKNLMLRTSSAAFTVAPPTGRNAGWVYAKDALGDYVGKLSPEGRVMLKGENAGVVRAEAERIGASLMDGPEALADFARRCAEETEVCIFCGRELTHPHSAPRKGGVGYGPICAEKWGLPWGG